MPYILFVIGMMDAPSIDYDKKERKKKKTPKTAKGEVDAVINALG